MEDAPLAGVRVIEVGTYMSVPFAGMMLADLGADVIKVEPPKGDPFRRFGRPNGPMASVFVNSNRGKRSIVLDLKEATDRARVRALLRTADVMLSNWRPGVAARLGLADDVIAELNPRLVRIYVSGYGSSGPDADKPTFDSVIQAKTAMAWAQGREDAPQLAVGYLVDKMTATMVAQAALAALYRRSVTGEGDAIEVPMLDVAAYLHYPDLFAMRTFVDDSPASPRNVQMSVNRPIRAADGWLIMAAVSSDQIRSALRAFDDLAFVDELFNERDGGQLTRRFIDRMEQHTGPRSVAECLARFDAADVPAARCLDPDGHFADPQVVHSELYDIVDYPSAGRVRQIRYPATSQRWGRLRPATPAPLLDRDRASVLRLAGE